MMDPWRLLVNVDATLTSLWLPSETMECSALVSTGKHSRTFNLKTNISQIQTLLTGNCECKHKGQYLTLKSSFFAFLVNKYQFKHQKAFCFLNKLIFHLLFFYILFVQKGFDYFFWGRPFKGLFLDLWMDWIFVLICFEQFFEWFVYSKAFSGRSVSPDNILWLKISYYIF